MKWKWTECLTINHSERLIIVFNSGVLKRNNVQNKVFSDNDKYKECQTTAEPV